ncbi:glycoside hydrolase/phage tail family protein [Ruegeria sp. 2012CJ41-6]|uniref:Glycoside hydrolase/phage tail family protein n=1 Tax=Ruegeria spongiae TaxID=2942209 RepID=A0ABT0PZX7_9RHOB|nr:glycoside hydrolase/phage tail family protein [Ruegeria spongiae]MCL6283098.1 glycoside hydrolase/phage tail family protein [Ruegeria spongiae]
MATIVLSAAGAAIGGSIGGTFAGLSSVAIGRAVGATVGRLIDNRLLGQGAEPVETGKVDRFRLTQSGEGAVVSRLHGRMRIAGQMIWASQFREHVSTSGGGGGGKGAPKPPEPKVTEYSYSVSLALALCEGEIASVGRVWVDGEEIEHDRLNMRVYTGSADQLPDPTMEAVEGTGAVPAYRGTAYVVMENLPLGQFGNRVPQFSFEVVRPAQAEAEDFREDLGQAVRAVAIVPGTGEYSLATRQVNYSKGWGQHWAANVHSPTGRTDFVQSMKALREEVPACGAVSLVVSWFGGDLRCGECRVEPKIERREIDGANMPWRVSDTGRSGVAEVPRKDGEPIYGGTPADDSVVEAIKHLQAQGKRVMFYPFILMDQDESNALSDPWSEAESQPVLPWRGRITLSEAPGRAGSPDKTAAADDEVAAFFGTAQRSHFQIASGRVSYSGPQEWSFRRFILHYAALCAAAGGVSAFCIGSEMRGLTQIRGANGFPAVDALRQLAADARAILGPDTKISYAADWSEYFGYQPGDAPGDRYFHLDPLWADENIDFIGIDNYMPMADWRDEDDHLDAQAGTNSIYDIGYLQSNIEGGEGFDWYYASSEARAAQVRTPITDGDHDEPWVWRYKDLRNWWLQRHFERIGGVRQAQPTDWVPGSKPFWFTELGCAAIDKGPNQPNKFLDPKSSESRLPHHSNGLRDDFVQMQYLKAVLGYWAQPQHNPVASDYDGRMIDMANAYVWAWDARPFPVFPNNREQWSDGGNYARGHWLNGRVSNRSLASVVSEICRASNLVDDLDVSELWGVVRGYVLDQVEDARAALQPLMLRYGFDAIERDGKLVFRLRDGKQAIKILPEQFAASGELDGDVELRREGEVDMTGRVRLRFVQAGGDFDAISEEAILPDDATHAVATSEIPLALTRAEGRQTVERWLAEARVSRDTARFALPPSKLALGAGDVVQLPAPDGNTARYRVDRVEQTDLQLIEAVRVEPGIYETTEMAEDVPALRAFAPPLPVTPMFLDLPLMTGDEVPHAPYLAVAADPWPGSVAVYRSSSDEDYELGEIIAAQSVIGRTETPLFRARPGLWDRGADLQVRLISGELESRGAEALLNGANLAAIGDGSSGNWELLQFAEAELIAPETYLLRNRLRGQLGSDALMRDVWPEGSVFVLLDRTVTQLGLSSSERRIARHFRIGPAGRGYDDPVYLYRVEAFDGNGLRPYAPVHLRADPVAQGHKLNWIRRTRIDGDSWDAPEVPLGEESESYLLRVLRGGSVLREATLGAPEWVYTAAMQAQDDTQSGVRIEVAQVSARFGSGPFAGLNWGQ